MGGDTVGRFDDRADDYAKHRPSYPHEAMADLLTGLGWPGMLTVADIGAGTGISSRLLADLGPLVVAVEPNAAMRAKAEPHDRVLWQDGTAEATGLRDGSVHLVVCAQAFHWFDAAAAFAEFARILRPCGRVALVWNEVDAQTPMGAGYREILDGLATDETPRVRYAAQEDPFAATDLFEGVKKASYGYERRHDAEGLIGRPASASYAPKHGPGREELERRLRALHAEHADGDGVAVLPYVTVSWTATMRGVAGPSLVRVEGQPG